MKKSYIPNIITTLNLVSGFLSIVFASEGNFEFAAALILVASIFDLTDGIVARLLKTSSQFGVELDSLSDAVSFGAAPAFLIYKFHFHTLGWIGIILSSFLLVFGVLRLARFNSQITDIDTKADFKGLPIPLSAITIAMFILYEFNTNDLIGSVNYIAIPLVLVLSIAMVSNIKYSAFPKLNKTTLKGKPFYLLFTIVGLILTFLTDGTALFYIFLGIVFWGIIKHFIRKFFPPNNDEQIELKEKQI
jgi:CDP-diacylglycerol--serine O-phosphatidyltransferase